MQPVQPVGLQASTITPSAINPLDSLQSVSLSKKYKETCEKTSIEGHLLFKYVYKGQKELFSLEVVRFAISQFPLESNKEASFSADKLIGPELDAFKCAFEYFRSTSILSAKEAITKIKSLQSADKSPNFYPNNVVLVDIFATDKDKFSGMLKLKADKEQNSAETHTICLWKKTNDKFMIIDPSSTNFSERLEKSVQLFLDGQGEKDKVKCNVLKHSETKFYGVPQNAKIGQKSKDGKKSRDCIDIALKIGFVLNTGIMTSQNVFVLQRSINFLSNQSAVNSLLGNANDGTTFRLLQSSKQEKRDQAVKFFTNIPPILKQFFKYEMWELLIKLDENGDKQEVILKILEDYSKEMPSFQSDKSMTFEQQIKRLEKLSECIECVGSLKTQFQDIADITFKLKAAPAPKKIS